MNGVRSPRGVERCQVKRCRQYKCAKNRMFVNNVEKMYRDVEWNKRHIVLVGNAGLVDDYIRATWYSHHSKTLTSMC